ATLVFGAVTGLLWLSTVPPTSALVAVMFGTRWLAMLFSFAFFSHQVGGFLGVLIGGVAFERTGSYDLVWWLSVLFGVLSAVINVPIVEKPVARPVMAPAWDRDPLGQIFIPRLVAGNNVLLTNPFMTGNGGG